ncbi:hypothetical protein BP00DRAFT_422021 [Aspergillus indologenus CBS 114.80]|uniref:Uncharacterized protein n=1 Tax=Aspergillus indologenus CBS 114.80 TaxID=1450541 RepID=A0A2V5IGT0_9EURO|nr:hypothetical protein BP00DRAFT_422021 [Aspergillus indologenus CBS 114.80]
MKNEEVMFKKWNQMELAGTVFYVNKEGTVDDALAGRDVRNLLTANARTGGRVDAGRGGGNRRLTGGLGIGRSETACTYEVGLFVGYEIGNI